MTGNMVRRFVAQNKRQFIPVFCFLNQRRRKPNNWPVKFVDRLIGICRLRFARINENLKIAIGAWGGFRHVSLTTGIIVATTAENAFDEIAEAATGGGSWGAWVSGAMGMHPAKLSTATSPK